MAPGTNIGAATPIDCGGARTSPRTSRPRSSRTRNALLRSISTVRNRNVEWALTTVADARSYTAEEAVAAGGVDGIGTHGRGGDRLRRRADGQRRTAAA